MNIDLIADIELINPWLNNPEIPIIEQAGYKPRIQTEKLLSPAWDPLCLILTGPRQAGKTTLGKHLCQELINRGRFKQLLYLNCDYFQIREWLRGPIFIQEALRQFKLVDPILFIDEVQRLENPGLLLKAIIDLKLPIKMIASGSSQLEIKSKVQEYLTGRQFECIVLPFSYEETPALNLEERALWGGYPGVVGSTEKSLVLQQLFSEYLNKDIIEILKISNPDVMQKLITLLAHTSGQLVRYQQLANDTGTPVKTVQHYLAILENTYVSKKITPFVGNKRSEIISNPIYYFIDNGFRNQALRNFNSLEIRADKGFLIKNLVFQEIYKFRQQYFKDFDIHFWRTTSGAEVDFVLVKNINEILPIEVKYQNLAKPNVSKAFRSFLQAYKPKEAVYFSKNYITSIQIENTLVHFLAVQRLKDFIQVLNDFFN
jgi:uncharacterized protein